MSFRNRIFVLIALTTLMRMLLVYSIGLGNDEVYYRMYAQSMQWNYFDHPPMVGWLIRLSTFNLQIDEVFFIRLGAIVCSAVASWLIYLCGKQLKDEQTGFLAALIYNFTIYGSIIAGTFILPDSPQMVCWLACLYSLLRFNKTDQINAYNKRNLLFFGIFAGLGMLCKIHTAFIWFGLFGYLLFYARNWFKQPALYISGCITLLFFWPVIQWNIDHHFITYTFHSKRVDVASGGFSLLSFSRFMLGQLIYTSPILFPAFIKASYKAIQSKLDIQPAQTKLLLWCSLPLIILPTLVSLFKEVLPHWTGPAYSGIILLTAVYFSQKYSHVTLKIPKVILGAGVLLITIIFVGIGVINNYPGTLGDKNEATLGKGDFTLDMYGWEQLRTQFSEISKADAKTEFDARHIISNNWFPAAHFDYYVAMPLHLDLIALGPIDKIHQYEWLNTDRKPLKIGENAYAIVLSDQQSEPKISYGALFEQIYLSHTITISRNNKACRKAYVYRLIHFKGKPYSAEVTR